MIVKVRREYLLEELEHRLRTLQKDLTSKFGFAQLKDGEVMSCALVSCRNCIHFDGNYNCETQEVLDLGALIVTLRAIREEYVEIEVKGKELEF